MMKICFACEMLLISGLVIPALCTMARADLISFERIGDFNDPLIDRQASGSITRMGLTASFTANNGTLYNTQDTFGINAKPSGDETSLLDSASGIVESITITFDQPVTFTQLRLRLFSDDDTAKLTVGLNPILELIPKPEFTDVYDFASDSFLMGNLLGPGQSLVIGAGKGNGFSLEGFQVNTVPEPTSLSMILPISAGLLLRRKRKP